MKSRVQEGVGPERSEASSLASGLMEIRVARVRREERKEERRDGGAEVGLLGEEETEAEAEAETEGADEEEEGRVSRVYRWPESRSHDSNAGSGTVNERGFGTNDMALWAPPVGHLATQGSSGEVIVQVDCHVLLKRNNFLNIYLKL